MRNVIVPFLCGNKFHHCLLHQYHDPGCFPLIRMSTLSCFLDLIITVAFQWKLGNSSWKKRALTAMDSSFLDLKASETLGKRALDVAKILAIFQSHPATDRNNVLDCCFLLSPFINMGTMEKGGFENKSMEIINSYKTVTVQNNLQMKNDPF